MHKDSATNTRELFLLEQRNVLAARINVMVAGAKERVKNTRRMIAQSKELLGKAHEALESSKVLRTTEQRITDRKP